MTWLLMWVLLFACVPQVTNIFVYVFIFIYFNIVSELLDEITLKQHTTPTV